MNCFTTTSYTYYMDSMLWRLRSQRVIIITIDLRIYYGTDIGHTVFY